MSDNEPSKVVLWSVPRSMSTILTKCLSFVPNSVIWFEPYISASYYGSDKRFTHPLSPARWKGEPGKDPETLAKCMEIPEGVGYDASKISYRWCQEQLEADYLGKRVVFVKDHSCGIDTRYDVIPRGYKHSFLIRNPLKVLTSWKKARYNKVDGPFEEYKMKDMEMPGTGYFFKESYDLYQHVKDNYDPNPIIIDADDLLANPGRVLKAYCNAMDIPYTDDLLHWDPSDKIVITWNIRRILLQLEQLDCFSFMGKALTSSEFLKPTKGPKRADLPDEDLECIDFCMPFYEKMYEKRLVC